MAEIAVIGCGHVGLVAVGCFAALGHQVTAVDVDTRRIELLRRGVPAIYEPGLEDLLRDGVESGRIEARDRYPAELDADFVFLAVGTPSSTGGASDLRAVRDAISALAPTLRPNAVIVNKSTVPIGTGNMIAETALSAGDTSVSVVSNPEFLQEGTAVDNFMNPDRVIVGSDDPDAAERVGQLYEDFGAPILRTDIRTAEMIKYASNAFLATKVSFINEMASICDVVNADVTEVARGMGLDDRIGSKFLRAGIGWGGSCFPKDVASLEHTASMSGAHPQLLRDVVEINKEQRRRIVHKIQTALGGVEGRRIVVLGAAFKPNTDDIRESPALEVSDLLRLAGAEVLVFDPHVSAEKIRVEFPRLTVTPDLIDAIEDADALVLATEWPAFIDLPLAELALGMRTALFIDGRNAMDARAVREAGFTYRCIGRPGLEGGPLEPVTHIDRSNGVGSDHALASNR